MDKLDKHPSWFKFKVERRSLLETADPKAVIDALLACIDYLEYGECNPASNEAQVVFSVFRPDVDEAWEKYGQRINARSQATEKNDQQ